MTFLLAAADGLVWGGRFLSVRLTGPARELTGIYRHLQKEGRD